MFKMMAAMCLLLGVLVAGVSIAAFFLREGLILDKTKVAIVVPREEHKTKFLVQYASTMDSVEELCEFIYADTQEEAHTLLENGEAEAIICFPKDFYEGVDDGRNTPPQVLVKDASRLETGLFVELIENGVRFLQVSEAGVYASIDIAKEYGNAQNAGPISERLVERFAKTLLMRKQFFETEILSPIGRLSLEKYLFGAFLFFSILLPGVFFGHFYQKQSQIIHQKLRVVGVGPVFVSVVRVAVMSLVLCFFGFFLYFTGLLLTKYGTYNLVYRDAGIFGKLILFCVAAAGLFHGIYGIAKSKKLGTIASLWLVLFSFFLSGSVIPMPFLPTFVQKADRVLHLSGLGQIMLEILYKELTFSSVMILVFVGLLGTMIGAFGLWKK